MSAGDGQVWRVDGPGPDELHERLTRTATLVLGARTRDLRAQQGLELALAFDLMDQAMSAGVPLPEPWARDRTAHDDTPGRPVKTLHLPGAESAERRAAWLDAHAGLLSDALDLAAAAHEPGLSEVRACGRCGCPDPRCADSTWEHECQAQRVCADHAKGAERAARLRDLAVQLRARAWDPPGPPPPVTREALHAAALAEAAGTWIGRRCATCGLPAARSQVVRGLVHIGANPGSPAALAWLNAHPHNVDEELP